LRVPAWQQSSGGNFGNVFDGRPEPTHSGLSISANRFDFCVAEKEGRERLSPRAVVGRGLEFGPASIFHTIEAPGRSRGMAFSQAHDPIAHAHGLYVGEKSCVAFISARLRLSICWV